ncbi:ABC transporter, permease protein [Shewanella piezotolerans WP3]|uniref:ABC transporter, permease protein n=1 Tax=Shewanella piezotolerans (strain WP3 / JCM 13877) TaxID=225849 RepID=B8CRM3_SHEPW|nr:ABC transporter permease [Shewanella piezotolerans]ACJ30031.1 ABC transporter, permease protein [Shewanella piezotolerans WP3]
MSFRLDFKYAVRLLLKKPIFTITSVLIVAIGLALTLYTYTLLENLVFKPLRLNGEQPIISIEARFDESHSYRRGVDPLDFQLLRESTKSLEAFGIYQQGTTLIGGMDLSTNTQKYNAALTEWNIFEFAGVQPIIGRGFAPDDHFEGAEAVTVISEKVWREYFNRDQNIVGSIIRVDALPTRVIGVMPIGFSFPSNAQVWLPQPHINVAPTQRSRTSLYAYARVKQGIDLSEFNQELSALDQHIIDGLPDDMSWRLGSDGGYLRALPFKQANTDITQYYNVFISMLVVVFLILLLACINIGNLLLGRVNERFKEIAIRVALGVPRLRLLLQMLMESVIICILGAVLAVGIVQGAMLLTNDFLLNMYAINGEKPFWWNLSLSNEGLILLVLSTLVVIGITGAIPAWRALSCDFNSVLRDGTRGALGRFAGKMTQMLVITEILLSCVVLVIATILLSSSYSASSADYGVETQKRLTAHLELPLESYPERQGFESEDRQKRTAFYYNLKARLEQLPNVEAISFMSQLPGTGAGTSFYEIQGKEALIYNENPRANTESVSRDAWRAVGMKLIEGRDFDQRDLETAMGNVIVNESIAADFFPDGNAVGSRIRRVWSSGHRDWQTIVGVVSDSYHGSTMDTASARYTLYRPIDSDGRTQMALAMHYSGSESLAIKSLLDVARQIDANVGVYHIQSYKRLINQPMLLVSAVSQIFLFCGLVAVFLAASGIYAVAANSVIQKTQEIGVRKALGATDRKVLKLFMDKAIMQLVVGLAIGASVALWITHLMEDAMLLDTQSYLFGFVGVPLLIAIIVILATFFPTRKAVLMEASEALYHN